VHNFGINRLSRPARPGPWPMLKPAWSSTIPARRQSCSPASNSALSLWKAALAPPSCSPFPARAPARCAHGLGLW